MLRAAVARALAGRGGFRMVMQGQAFAPQSGLNLTQAQGRVIMWPLENTPNAIWQLFAALDAGVLPLLLPSALPAIKLAGLRARYPGFGWLVSNHTAGNHNLGPHIEWPSYPVQAHSDLFFGLLTSGSTGEPKAIVTSAARLANGVQAIHSAQQLENIGATGVLLPLAYSFACVNQLLWSVLQERELHFPGPLADMATCLTHIRESGVDMLCMVAHQARALSRLGARAQPLPAVRCLNFAGAPFPLAQFAFLRHLFPNARLLNNYGCAEAMPRLTSVEVTTPDTSIAFVGQPIGDIALRIEGNTAGGPVLFHGSSTALGTIGVDGSLQPFGEWIASGDLGRIDAAGLHILGRHDQIVKIGGERLSLLEVEQAFMAFGASQALVWLQEQGDIERIIAVIQMPAPPSLQALLQCLRQHLPRPLLPAEIHWTEQWQINANHKTDRPTLQAKAQSGQLHRIWPPDKSPSSQAADQ
jgi:acyl-CoA synthetase (AMP-forming)/AMP-acid ligase II